MKQIYLRGSGKKIEFESYAAHFMNRTESLVESKLTPGGFYTGVWCRDASYIINELEEMGRHALVEQHLKWIWRNQITKEIDFKCAFGRGSPETGYKMQSLLPKSTDDRDLLTRSNGALPTSIQNGYCEIYGQNPDIDSTALIVSVTCKCCLKNKPLANKLLPQLRAAMSFLDSRDIDGDRLLEQGPNEDWMDRMLRSGKLAYNQGIWIMALNNWAHLLEQSGYESEASEMNTKANLVIDAVEAHLWNSHKGSYMDLEADTDLTRGITLDLCFLLLAIRRGYKNQDRAEKSFKAIENALWNMHGSACQEFPTKLTSPPALGPYKYQNGGVWPWISATEILSRLEYGQRQEPRLLLERILPVAHLEWIDPHNIRSGGAFPFRTGIAAVRTALRKFNMTRSGI